ncbi:uncharacterized protein J3D65DRAFT_662766 [Phyllosticta citribraziliensis]|uniref:Secreted protein n=1 Tax=Phyllosticta citribraziliensis TaxID=989973 RepID=A0ABR1L599_9PEZI
MSFAVRVSVLVGFGCRPAVLLVGTGSRPECRSQPVKLPPSIPIPGSEDLSKERLKQTSFKTCSRTKKEETKYGVEHNPHPTAPKRPDNHHLIPVPIPNSRAAKQQKTMVDTRIELVTLGSLTSAR